MIMLRLSPGASSAVPMPGLSTGTFPSKPIVYEPPTNLFLSYYFSGPGLRLYSPATFQVSFSRRFRSSGRFSDGGGEVPKIPREVDPVLDISSIRSHQVRLIDEEQNNVGIVKKSVALQMAEDAQLDLVVLSRDADPPVLRIMDYNKYRFEQQKKKKLQQNKAVHTDLKKVKMGYNIETHDYSVRLRAAQRFLKDGDKVKVIVSLEGREKQFRNNAIELIKRFQNDLGELALEEAQRFKDENLFVVLAPNKAVLQRGREGPKKNDKPVATDDVSASEVVPAGV